MSYFERKPKEEKDPQAHVEELKYGRFSVPAEEKERIIKKAIADGKDPEETLREHEERLARATGRLREGQKEEAIKDLERDMNKQFRDKKNEGE